MVTSYHCLCQRFICSESSQRHSKSFVYARSPLSQKNSSRAAHVQIFFLLKFKRSSSVGFKFQNAEIFKFTNFFIVNYIHFFVSLRFARFVNFELITCVSIVSNVVSFTRWKLFLLIAFLVIEDSCHIIVRRFLLFFLN